MIKVVTVDAIRFELAITGIDRRELQKIAKEYKMALPEMIDWIINEGINERIDS